MHMDAHALENLDIFEAKQANSKFGEKGSLIEYIDYTASQFGKRKLK